LAFLRECQRIANRQRKSPAKWLGFFVLQCCVLITSCQRGQQREQQLQRAWQRQQQRGQQEQREQLQREQQQRERERGQERELLLFCHKQ